MQGLGRRTFSALKIRNYRLFFIGQLISVSGTWMQRVAQAWLVLDLSGSGFAVGAVTAAQFISVLILGSFGGLIADRTDKRRLLFYTQSVEAVLALGLGILVLSGAIQVWMVFIFALSLGAVEAFDNPARQAFLIEMVGPEEVANAVGLNMTLTNTSRVLGPALGGWLIVAVGIGLCFLYNAASFIGAIVALALMKVDQLQKAPPEPRQRGQVIEGFRYVRSRRILWVPLLVVAVVSCFAWELEVVLPVMARFTFEVNAGGYGLMFAALGAGAVIGSLLFASTHGRPVTQIGRAAMLLSGAMLLTSLAPSYPLALASLVLVGGTGAGLFSLTFSHLQLAPRPGMRGRVLALRLVAFLGTRPLGAPLMGWVAEHGGPRQALAVGAAACLAVGWWANSALDARRSANDPTA